jgi:hypothetical protein
MLGERVGTVPAPRHVAVKIHAEHPLEERVLEGKADFEERNVGGHQWRGSVCDKRTCGTKRQAKGNVWSQRRTPCFVMLLSVDGSHGLDLSFVTHIFLLDKVPRERDASRNERHVVREVSKRE